MSLNRGKRSLRYSILSWSVFVAFTLVSWWAISVEFAGYKAGTPRPGTPLMSIFSGMAFLSFPLALVGFVQAVLGLIRRDGVVDAIAGGILSVSLVLCGLWLVIHVGE
jgi:hypothetical protein